MAANVRHFSEDGATAITQVNWPDAFAGQNQMPRKFAFQNVGDRPLGGAGVSVEIQQAVSGQDGQTMLRLATDLDTLPGPYGVTATAQAGTGSFATLTTKGYKVTSLSAIGESNAAMEATAPLSATSNVVALSWTAVPLVTGYRVYRTDTPGTYPGSSLLVQLPAIITSILDGGGATLTGSPPVDNRTAGWLTTLALSGAGAGGVWAGTGNKFYRVEARDSTGALIAASLEASVNVDDVTKTVTVSWVAVPDASTYRIYRSEISGSYPSPSLRATVNAPTTMFVDDGAALSAGTITALASYGVPPTSGNFSTNPLVPSTSIAIFQTVFYWVNRVVPAATPEAGNPRTALIVVKEA